MCQYQIQHEAVRIVQHFPPDSGCGIGKRGWVFNQPLGLTRGFPGPDAPAGLCPGPKWTAAAGPAAKTAKWQWKRQRQPAGWTRTKWTKQLGQLGTECFWGGHTFWALSRLLK